MILYHFVGNFFFPNVVTGMLHYHFCINWCVDHQYPVSKIVFCAFNRQRQNINYLDPCHAQINMYSSHAMKSP